MTHQILLGQLSRALGAFQADLRTNRKDNEVCTLVFSEFGRRVAENGSKGTDHGAGAPAFLVGPMVRGGMHGQTPDLSNLDEGDVPYSLDFRSIYRTLEQNWMGLKSSIEQPALELIHS